MKVFRTREERNRTTNSVLFFYDNTVSDYVIDLSKIRNSHYSVSVCMSDVVDLNNDHTNAVPPAYSFHSFASQKLNK